MPSRFRLRLAVDWLRQGGIVAYPTEAVYGLGCDPFDPVAVARLLALKNRSPGKGLILIAADYRQIEPLLAVTGQEMADRLQRWWPGPVTAVIPAAPGVPAWLCGSGKTLAVRVTAHLVARALCQAFGRAIVSTSANRSRLPPATTRVGLRKYFRSEDALFVPGSLGHLSRPTPIYDAVSGRQLREG